MAVVCPAYADTNVTVRRTGDERAVEAEDKPAPDALRFGDIRGGRIVKSALTKDKVTLEIASTTWFGVNLDVPLALPAGTRISGLSVTIAGHTETADLLRVSDARARYRSIVGWNKDPAFLEHEIATSTSEQFTLHVFPVSEKTHAFVTLELASAEAPRVVDDDLGLIAGQAVPQIVFGCGLHAVRGLDKEIIRRYVKLHIEKLAYCYQRELLSHPTLAGTADLHFTIRPSGRVEEIYVDGTLEKQSVRECLADELTTWSFSPTDLAIQVNYPLTFKPAGT
jgi:hypothetical protein